MKKNKTSKKFTVVGYWDDSQQPYVEFVLGRNENDALKNLHRQLIAENENGAGPAPDQIWVVGVFAGWNKETGGMGYTTRLADMFEDEMPKEVEA